LVASPEDVPPSPAPPSPTLQAPAPQEPGERPSSSSSSSSDLIEKKNNELAMMLHERERQLESKAQMLVEAHMKVDDLTEQLQKSRGLAEKVKALQRESHLYRAEKEAREELEARVRGLVEEGQKLVTGARAEHCSDAVVRL
jgi:hypothetical protein